MQHRDRGKQSPCARDDALFEGMHIKNPYTLRQAYTANTADQPAGTFFAVQKLLSEAPAVDARAIISHRFSTATGKHAAQRRAVSAPRGQDAPVVQDAVVELHQPRHPGRFRPLLLLCSGGWRMLRRRRGR